MYVQCRLNVGCIRYQCISQSQKGGGLYSHFRIGGVNANAIVSCNIVNQLKIVCDLISRILGFCQIRKIKMRKLYCRA